MHPIRALQISCNTEKWHIRVHTIRVLTTLGWNNLPAYLSCPGTWLPLKGRELGSCSSLHLYLQHVAAPSLHVHWWDQVKSREEMLRASQKSLYHLQTSWRGRCGKKKPPLSLSNLNSCHINNLLHWDVQIPDTSSQLCNIKHQEGKHSEHLSRFMWPRNLLKKLILHGTHLEKHRSRYSQFKLCHTQLWVPLLSI